MRHDVIAMAAVLPPLAGPGRDTSGACGELFTWTRELLPEALSDNGITAPNDGEAVAYGEAICHDLRNGAPPSNLALIFGQEIMHLTAKQAAIFVDQSALNLCPEVIP